MTGRKAMSRRDEQRRNRAARERDVDADDVWRKVFGEVAGWQESHWGASGRERDYADKITDQIMAAGTVAGLTEPMRRRAIRDAVINYMDCVTRDVTPSI